MQSSSCLEQTVGETLADWFRRQLRDHAYPGYVYGYPHKKAYRPLERPVSLADAWATEDRQHLFCYVHVPFCNQRCSFCNLFTYVPASGSPGQAFLESLSREMDLHAQALTPFRFSRLYIGGGTPTWLEEPELRRLFRLLRETLGVRPEDTEGCIETSPETLDAGKVALLREAGFQRISLGVQSFVEEELRAVNRRFEFGRHRQALDLLARAGFPRLNVDLIYGLPGQTLQSWRHSLDIALDSPATSLFLYPLYIRPLTGLAVRQRVSLNDPISPSTREMGRMYDLALDRLAAAGFRQQTMRQFRRDQATDDSGEVGGAYRCQEHGMLGLGPGARSYTRGWHYSTPWKMVSRNIRDVVDQWATARLAGDASITYGFAMDDDERQRRYVIQSLLHDGLVLDEDGRAAWSRFSEARQLLREEGCIVEEPTRVRLTARGVRHADIVGQLFFSSRVRRLMDEWEYDT